MPMRTHLAEEIKSSEVGKKVTVGGWVSVVRSHGNILFLIVRDRTGTIQVTAKKGDVSQKIMNEINQLGREWVVLVKGTVRKSTQAPRGVEIIPDEIEVLNTAEPKLPLDSKVKANLETRLNWRFLDFRTPRTNAIFKIQANIVRAFREYLIDSGFMEMQPPCIIASASEGGADLFAIPYFEKEAFLAQSPQLYKQMGAISFEKVFMMSPVWRAEKFDTPTHLNEIRQMDAEMAFADDEEAMSVLENCVVHILKTIKKENSVELEILERKLEIPKLPLKRINYSDAINLLKKKGEIIEFGDDFTKSQENILKEIIGQDAFFLKDWPSTIKAFYAMPYEDNPTICHAFDLIYQGIEISSGTQRVHLPDLLAKKIKDKELNPANFEYYINCFRYGAPPHAGWSIGLERLTLAVTGMNNIRECCMFPRDRNRLTP